MGRSGKSLDDNDDERKGKSQKTAKQQEQQSDRNADNGSHLRQQKADHNNNYKSKDDFRDNNNHLWRKKVKEAAKDHVKRSLKPGASVGLITGAVQIVNMIKNGNLEPYSDGGIMNAKSGSDPGILDGQDYVPEILVGKTVYARAAVAEGRIGLGDVASIGASALSAGAHAETGLNYSVGVNASVVRVDVNLGPVQVGAGLNFDTHASIGVNGVSASFLGMGFSVGPRIGIQTPFLDLSFTLF